MSASYKDTVLLPKTEFPMKADLVIREPERLAKWEAAGLYGRIQTARAGAPRFILHDGPPFANGDVHMGTALNKVLKDLIVKSKSMAGFDAPFVPGWDCHGLPIEFKVVKESRGLAPAEIRRRSEEYARKFIDIQRGQFKRLGVFGDWASPYLTLAPEYEAEILRAFARFIEAGLVYQSKKPVYWSTGAQTALAEAEVEYLARVDPAIYVAFPLQSGHWAGQGDCVIWTTTPWTLPANVAIALQPKAEYVLGEFQREGDTPRVFVVARALIEPFSTETGWLFVRERAVATGAELAGGTARHPFLDRESLLIAAEFVTLDTGTGQVHCAPGHGADDYAACRAVGLPVLSPVDDHGKLTAECGVPEWVGRYVFDANPGVIEKLRALGALVAHADYPHDYPHCWRSKTPIVFRSVEQFFIRVDQLRQAALAAIDGVNWLPHWGRNRIHGTVEARPDWCISRQRTWGVPLPIFYAPSGEPMLDAATARKVADIVERAGTNIWFEQDDAWWASELGLPAGCTRRNDTLDVWIDSGVSHEAVLRRRPELAFPADVYLEATDQHRGWFQSSLMTSVGLNGVAPYRTVITHGFVVDKDTRKKISKSEQGAYVKPMNAEHFVGTYGADIVRLWAASVDYNNEVPFSEETFKQLAESYRQFRNILRILLANLFDFPRELMVRDCDLAGATIVDRWMLSRLQAVIAECVAGYDAYDFRKVYQVLNQFFTVDLSALYVDVTKDRMYCDAPDSARRRATQGVMARVFDACCQLLAPILVFTADEAWEHSGRTESVHLSIFPSPRADLVVPDAESVVERWIGYRTIIAQQAVEPARKAKTIGKSQEARVTLAVDSESAADELRLNLDEAEEFFTLSDFHVAVAVGQPVSASMVVTPHPRCARCWRHRLTVGIDSGHPELCDRCVTALGQVEYGLSL
jgi:isoleucyl-tRNA synthetase